MPQDNQVSDTGDMIHYPGLCEHHGEDRVGATALVVHACGSSGSVLVAHAQPALLTHTHCAMLHMRIVKIKAVAVNVSCMVKDTQGPGIYTYEE